MVDDEQKLFELCTEYYNIMETIEKVFRAGDPSAMPCDLNTRIRDIRDAIAELARVDRELIHNVLLHGPYDTADALYKAVTSAIEAERVWKKMSMRYLYGSPFTKERPNV